MMLSEPLKPVVLTSLTGFPFSALPVSLLSFVFYRSKDVYLVPSMCPSVPQTALLDATWPSVVGPSETMLGLCVEMVPAPRGAFERLIARLSDVFHVLEGLWRSSDLASSLGAGVLLRPRDLDIGPNVLLLVRMDDTGR
jgi:hypothetical protein